jgi:hypothetical protein
VFPLQLRQKGGRIAARAQDQAVLRAHFFDPGPVSIGIAAVGQDLLIRGEVVRRHEGRFEPGGVTPGGGGIAEKSVVEEFHVRLVKMPPAPAASPPDSGRPLSSIPRPRRRTSGCPRHWWWSGKSVNARPPAKAKRLTESAGRRVSSNKSKSSAIRTMSAGMPQSSQNRSAWKPSTQPRHASQKAGWALQRTRRELANCRSTSNPPISRSGNQLPVVGLQFSPTSVLWVACNPITPQACRQASTR